MKKRLVSLLVCLLLLSMLTVSVFAASPWVVDQANLLDETEEALIAEECEKVRSQYGMDMVFLTVDSLEGKTAEAYADDYYDYNGYSPDGILFLVAMDEREWHISTSGAAIDALSDGDLEALGDYIVLFLSDGDFYSGFLSFAEEAPRYFGEGKAIHINWILSLVVGAAVSGIVLLVMRSLMNTRTAQSEASAYESKDSFKLKVNQDLFLYSQVTKTKKPEPSSSSGGSTVHRSSSGRSHGGRGGKF